MTTKGPGKKGKICEAKGTRYQVGSPSTGNTGVSRVQSELCVMGAKQLTIGATWQWGLIPMRLSLSHRHFSHQSTPRQLKVEESPSLRVSAPTHDATDFSLECPSPKKRPWNIMCQFFGIPIHPFRAPAAQSKTKPNIKERRKKQSNCNGLDSDQSLRSHLT